jgi:hypothetical protein
VAYALSPLYRGLTVQFKTYATAALKTDHGRSDINFRYIQMSAMIFGGMIEADARMVRYHQAVRSHKKLQSDIAVWRAYENEFEERGTPAVASESKAQGRNAGQ